MPGGRPHHARWAEEVDEEEAHQQEEQLGSPLYDETSGQYRSSDGVWCENMDVERGQSKQRLNLQHGFMRSIVSQQLHSVSHACLCPACKDTCTPHAGPHAQARVTCRASEGACSSHASFAIAQVANQKDRNAYEQSWKEAYREASPFQQRWGVGIKVPEDELRRRWEMALVHAQLHARAATPPERET